MPKALTVVGGKAQAVNPVLDGDGHTIIGLNITLSLTLADIGGGGLPSETAQMIVDGWPMLSSQQKTNMQDIRDTIMAAVTASLA
jgi:hypothetical protein